MASKQTTWILAIWPTSFVFSNNDYIRGHAMFVIRIFVSAFCFSPAGWRSQTHGTFDGKVMHFNTTDHFRLSERIYRLAFTTMLWCFDIYMFVLARCSHWECSSCLGAFSFSFKVSSVRQLVATQSRRKSQKIRTSGFAVGCVSRISRWFSVIFRTTTPVGEKRFQQDIKRNSEKKRKHDILIRACRFHL